MEDKKKYKIVASDLDGTLLNEEQTVSPENLQAIGEMKQLGVEFVPTTGRALNEIHPALMQSPDMRYIITSDGAAVWDKKSEIMVITRYISKDTVRLILDTIRPYNVFIVAHEDGKTYYDKQKYTPAFLNTCRIDSYFGHIISQHATAVENLENFLAASDKVEMMALFFELEEAIVTSKQIFENSGRLCAARSAENNLEVYSSDAGKGKTLAAFADALGVDISDVIAVGDSNNDITLVETAGLGLAMENASNELKSIADQTICKNSEHCARYILEKFIQ
jgi:Cof subfamily protein (haloacid dehalogenase superfamily)